jgi:CzcA family heavy metal efflux pump
MFFDSLIRYAIANRLLVLAIGALIIVYGGWVIRQLPIDVFPNLNRPTVTIFTEIEGLAPEEVERLVSWPIETTIMGASHVTRVRSASSVGLSIVWVEYDWNTDIYQARQIVSEKLQTIQAQLPINAKPVMGPISSIMGEIMLIGVTGKSDEVTAVTLREFGEWELRKRLIAIPGIAEITVIGGDLPNYHIKLEPHLLLRHQISLNQAEEAIANSNINNTGGFLTQPYQEVLIRTLGRIHDVVDLQSIPIFKENNTNNSDRPITLGDISHISLAGPLNKRGDASVNQKAAVILSIQKQPNADTIALSAAIHQEINVIKQNTSPSIEIHTDIFQQDHFIERAIHNVIEALRDGAILVSIVLFLFLLNIRTTFITLTAIPLSFVLTACVFSLFNMSINTMTLGGLAIAIGELVDDAIVDVENIYRRLRQNQQRPTPLPALHVIYLASKEVRSSIIFATIIVVLVFIPLFAMSGMEGKIFLPLGVAYITSILASLVVSLTITPALCSYLLPRMASLAQNAHKEGWVVRIIKHTQHKALDFAFKYKGVIIIAISLLGLCTLSLIPFFGKEFLPPFNEGSLTINILTPPGTNLSESNRVGSIAERLISEIPEAGKTGRRTGRAERDDHAEGIHSSEIEVEIHSSSRTRSEILSDIRNKLSSIPGITFNIGQPISHRLDHMMSGVRAALAIKIFGPDLTILRHYGTEIESLLSKTPDIADISIEKQILIPQLHILLNQQKIAYYGKYVGNVAEDIELALQGKTIGSVVKDDRIYPIILRLSDAIGEDINTISNLPMDYHNGQPIPLKAVAQIEMAKGPNIINREQGERRIVIQANITSRDMVGTVENIQALIEEKIHLPPGYRITYGGQFESQARASSLILLLGLGSVIIIYLVLLSYFRSYYLALQIMLSVPFAFLGAIIGVWFSSAIWSIATMIGFITLTGIATRNGIMLTAHYIHLIEEEGQSVSMELIYQGAKERIIPVLMTALTAALALIPLLLFADKPGRELLHPVAVVIFCGLCSSTLLDLIIRPLMFWHIGEKAMEQRQRNRNETL